MDPKSRPTFEDLADTLEDIIRQHSNARSPDTTLEVVRTATDDQSSCHSNSPEVAGCCHLQKTDKAVQPTHNNNNNNNKFDHDVYLVPGSSPSEKARCHYLQGRSGKEKPLK